MDPTKEENQNDIETVDGGEASEEKLYENGDNLNPNPNLNPNENNIICSTSNPPPAKKPHYFDLNFVYIELDDNDTQSEVVEPATVNEHPEVTEPRKENMNAYPENVEPDWDVGNEPTNVIDISDSDSEVTQTFDDEKKTILCFKHKAADKSPVHDWGGIVPFKPFVPHTAESSLGAPKRKLTNGLVKVKEEKADED